MRDYQILFLGLDGTILKSNHTIQNSTKTAILEMKSKGIAVVIATGRPYHEITNLGKELQIDSFITCNGGFGFNKGQEIFEEKIDPAIIKTCLKLAQEHHHHMILYTENQ